MISIAPGLFLISFFSILSALLILYFNLYNINLLENTPIIAAFAFGSQKLIPLLQNIFNAISRSRSSYFVAKDILFFLKKKSHKSAFSENIKHDKVLLNFKEFKKKLTLKNIYFKHSDQKDFILKGINIVINKGEKILIRGDSGSGKSTLIDIISGIVFPNKGKIIMDGININRKNLEVLHRQIAYVPQNIFISEDTFLNNIVVGKNKDEINFGDIKKASKIAEIYEFIVKKDLGFNAVVNHEGLNLSGGQRQRIGIARAIYKNSPILILDESTNALNSRIEKKIIQNIFKLGKNKTIIIVSHKDLKKFKFDKVYSLN
jgi:ATP-binding cassette subfamily B protein